MNVCPPVVPFLAIIRGQPNLPLLATMCGVVLIIYFSKKGKAYRYIEKTKV